MELVTFGINLLELIYSRDHQKLMNTELMHAY